MDHAPGVERAERPRSRIDWELIACGLRGHALVGTDAASVREQDALFARQADGVRWHRCLRCDSWLPVLPPADPIRQHPPPHAEIQLPLRGRPLRDRVMLRLIALDRVVHFVILTGLGLVVLLLAANEHSLRASFYRVVSDLQGGVGGGPVVATGHVGIIHELDKLFSLRSGRLELVGSALIAYGVMEGVEAVGLWYARRWAEYLTFVATTVLLPFEVYELSHGASPLKLIGFLVNLVVVVYLLFAKRLFGLRGGAGAEERARQAAVSWEVLQRATPWAEPPTAAGGNPTTGSPRTDAAGV